MNTQALPWYKQFWPWFLIAIPFSSVVMGVVMITLATTQKDSLVKEEWYKDGMAINQTLDKQKAASERGIEAYITVDTNGDKLFLETQQLNLAQISELTLEFSHPTLEAKDFVLKLYQTPDRRFYAPLPNAIQGFYYARLSAPHADWEILSGINFSNSLQHVALHKIVNH